MDKPQQPWDPYTRDCSQGYCSYYCLQFCFFLFPSAPPPPPPPPSSHPLLSPLLISVIVVTSTAFILLTYYLLLARYRRAHLNRRSGPTSPPENGWSPSAPAEGLDDSLIGKIALCRYRRGGGLVADGTDCSVCLSPFEDGDGIRLLPKCGHVFHQSCIDTWLKSHCSCPLCRAGIFPLPAAAGIVIEDQSRESEPDMTAGRVETSHEIIEIGDRRGVVGRSFSMDSTFRRHTNTDTDTDTDTNTDTNSSRWNRTLHSVLSPVRMKRLRSMRNNSVGRGRGELLPT